MPRGGRDKSQQLPVLCCQRAKIVHRSASQKGPAWAWARLLSALGLETDDADRALQSTSWPAPCLCRLRCCFIGREKAGCWTPRPPLVLLGVSGCESCGEFAEQALQGCWAAGLPGLRVQGCRLRLGLPWAYAGQHSAGPGGDPGQQPGAVAKSWLL